MLLRIYCAITFAVLVPAASSHARVEAGDGEKEYRFVAQLAGNSIDHYMCVGLAGAIDCLEAGTEVEGLESSEDLAGRLWNELIDSEDEDGEFVFRRDIRLRDGTKVSSCSKAAIEEIGFLIQEEYSRTIKTKLWQETVTRPDPNTPEGRALLKTRQKYLDLLNKEQEHRITSEQELKEVFNDGDRLVALSGRGRRLFENGAPPKLIEKHHLKIDPKTGKYSAAVPSAHAFLLTYDDENKFYVYDSDDPDGKWPVTVKGSGVCKVRDGRPHRCTGFTIRWRIDDHMGNGPTQQVYYDVSPLDEVLGDVSDIVEAVDEDD